MGRPARLLAGLGALAALAACLTTREPAFDEASTPAPEESAAFAAFLSAEEAHRAALGLEPTDLSLALRDLERPGVLRVVAEAPMLLLQYRNDSPDADCAAEACVIYFGLHVLPDGTPEACFVNPGEQAALTAVAGRMGLGVTFGELDATLEGPREALAPAVLAAFADPALVVCAPVFDPQD